MYTQVYQHHARLVADDMLMRAVNVALEESTLSKEKLIIYRNNKEFLEYFYSLDDNSLVHLLLSKPSSKAADIMERIQARNLLKRGYQKTLRELPGTTRLHLLKLTRDEATKYEKKIARKVNTDPIDMVFHIASYEEALKMYQSFGKSVESGEIPLMFVDSHGREMPYEDKSPISVKEGDKIVYVFCPKEKVKDVGNVAKEILEK
ncbi:MAG: hypothetical protein ACUVWK_06895 [Nitrososphaerales archaeon]